MRIHLFSICLLAIIGCQKVSIPPAPNFTSFDFNNKRVDFSVEFIPFESSNIYHWEFGDSSTGVGEKVSHQYANSGKYLVKLKTFNSDGIFVNRKEITVKNSIVQNPFDTSKIQIGSFEILSIQLQKYGLKKPNGDNWDPSFDPDPDIFLKVLSSNGATVLKTNEFTPFSLPHDYYPMTFGILLSASTSYSFQLLDDEFFEGGGEELMVSKSIKLSDYILSSNPKPTKIQLELDNNNIIQLSLRW